jgi:hypothetical protein
MTPDRSVARNRPSAFAALAFIVNFMAISGTMRSWADELVYATAGNGGESFAGPVSFYAGEIGNQVRLSGRARHITSFQVIVSPQGQAVTADFKARFYANDGDDGAPGSLLGESDWFIGVTISGEHSGIGWGLSPGFQAPDVLTWTLEVANPTPIAIGLPQVNPTSPVGESLASWFGSPGAWTKAGVGGASVFSASIFAAALPGDYDGDNDVDGADFMQWQRSHGLHDATADGNRDGAVDGEDMDVWKSRFPTPAAGAVIPEPGSAVLAAIGSAVFWLRFRAPRGARQGGGLNRYGGRLHICTSI